MFSLLLPNIVSVVQPSYVYAEEEKKEDGDEEKKEPRKPNTNNVGMIEQDKFPGYKVIGYEGFITNAYIRKVECVESPKTEGFYEKLEKGEEKEGGYLVRYVAAMIAFVVDGAVTFFFEVTCEEASGSFTMNIGKELGKLGDPINITNNYIVMKLAGVMQYLAYGLSLVFVMIYGMSYMMGKSEISPPKFFMRTGFVVMGIYIAPYVLQDVLNLNNVLVYHISQIKVTFDGSDQPVSLAVPKAFHDFMSSSADLIQGNLLLGIVMVAMIIYTLKPMFDIAMWWYTRMLKIFFYAIISPILVMMMILPKTANMAKKAFKDFVGESFSQFVVMIGIATIAMMLGNLMDMRYILELSDVGLIIFMFTALNFMADLPNMAKNITGGLSGGGRATTAGLTSFAMNLATAKGVKDIANNTKRIASNANGVVKAGFQAPGKISAAKDRAIGAVKSAAETATHNRTSAGSENKQSFGVGKALKEKGIAGVGNVAAATAGRVVSKAQELKDNALGAGILTQEVLGKHKHVSDALSLYKVGVKDYNDKKYVANELKKENREGQKDLKQSQYSAAMAQKRKQLLEQAKNEPGKWKGKGSNAKPVNFSANVAERRHQTEAKFLYKEAEAKANIAMHDLKTGTIQDPQDRMKDIKRETTRQEKVDKFMGVKPTPTPTPTKPPKGGGGKGKK